MRFAVNHQNHVRLSLRDVVKEGFRLNEVSAWEVWKMLCFCTLGGMQYKTIYHWDFSFSYKQYHDNFDHKVNEAISEGFRPLGPAAIDWTGTIRQTMVRDSSM